MPQQQEHPYNGRTGEMLRWVVNLVLAGIVAWLSANGAMQAQIAVLTERENNHYVELIRRFDRLEQGLSGGGGGSR